MIPRNLHFDDIEDTDHPPVKRIKNLLDDPWIPDPGRSNPGRKQIAGSRISTEAQFRRAAKTVLDRRRREEEARGFLRSRKPTPQLIGTATPATPPQKPATPWWQSGRFEDIGGGLRKIAAKPVEDLAMLPEVVQRGKLRFQTVKNMRNAVLEHNGYRSIFKLQIDGTRETWILTHFVDKEGEELLR